MGATELKSPKSKAQLRYELVMDTPFLRGRMEESDELCRQADEMDRRVHEGRVLTKWGRRRILRKSAELRQRAGQIAPY